MHRKLEELRRRALELRRLGYSYPEIACELDCSLYKVWEVLSPAESPQSRLGQTAEPASRVEELSERVEEMLGTAYRIKPLEELSREVSWLEEELLGIKEEFEIFDENLYNALVGLWLIARVGGLGRDRCEYNVDGYCYHWYWTKSPQELDYDESKRDSWIAELFTESGLRNDQYYVQYAPTSKTKRSLKPYGSPLKDQHRPKPEGC